MVIRITTLPSTLSGPLLTQVTEKFKGLRLHALQTSPSSFSSKYETEAKFADEDWHGRLCNEDRVTVIAFADTRERDGVSVDELVQLDWVGLVTVLGPYTVEHLAGFMDISPALIVSELEPGDVKTFGLVSLFVDEAYRGRGVATELIKRCEAVASAKLLGPRSVGVVGMTATATNKGAIRLYKHLGYTEAGSTLAHAGEHETYMQKVLPKSADLVTS